jgi:ABC-2 type transport system ATP-binding protein
MITVENLTFDYPNKRALHHIAFTIAPKTITALVGPNGAGKSTLMRSIAALDLPIQGSIFVDGIDIFEAPREIHTKMGYLPDFFGLYDDLSVKQCLLYHALAQNIPQEDCEKRVHDTAERLQLNEVLSAEVGTLSRGQRQRLGIAQSIIHSPKVLLLDEPAAGLDPEARNHLSQLLLYLCKEGITILVSSHILSELEDYCSHMIILRDGYLVKHCAIDEAKKSMMDIYLETSEKT